MGWNGYLAGPPICYVSSIIYIPARHREGQYLRRPTQSGTVPLFVEQFQKKWSCSTFLRENVELLMLEIFRIK
jgi:hypothetical protein